MSKLKRLWNLNLDRDGFRCDNWICPTCTPTKFWAVAFGWPSLVIVMTYIVWRTIP